MTTSETSGTGLDDLLAGAVELAREAAVAVVWDAVGEYQGVQPESEFVVTHAFASTLPGYAGWHWAVTITRIEDTDHVTVDEVVQLPGDGALLAPAWVPWDQRVRAGDLSPGDLLPAAPDDPRLVPAYVYSEDPAVEVVAFELGLGRERVMSRDGRLDTADRWQAGDRGPDSPMARQAPQSCGTCGFFLPLAGSLAASFGVCGNEVTDSDGQVVSVQYGCGAHSQVEAETRPLMEVQDLVFDDGDEITANEITANDPPTAAEDVTTPDVTTPDAATPDAATPDAATPDAATPDAATPDAATVDEADPS